MLTVTEEQRKKVLSYRWIVLGTLWLVYFFVYFDRVAPAVVAPELMKAFGISAASMGLLSAAYFYPYAAMQIPSGILADFMGPRMAVTIFFIIAGIGTALFGLAQTYEWARCFGCSGGTDLYVRPQPSSGYGSAQSERS